MQRRIFQILPTRVLARAITIAICCVGTTSQAQAQPAQLSYRFYNQEIPLSLSPDQLAVSFKAQPTGTRGSIALPNHLRLQQDLQKGTTGVRGASNALEEIVVKPLGKQYALLELPKQQSSVFKNQLQQQLQQPYIKTSVPVLQRDQDDTPLLLTNEMVVSFEPDFPKTQVRDLLELQGLELIRPLGFSQHQYLVRSKRGDSLRLLSQANELTSLGGIQSATPNFVQQASYGKRTNQYSQFFSATSQATSTLPLRWHLDSPSSAEQRPDLRVSEAWKQGATGKDVVVAVIDSLIQWDHPDLKDNLHDVDDSTPFLLPGEVHGWDFSSPNFSCNEDQSFCVQGDPETRLDADEANLLGAYLHSAILSDEELLTESEWHAEHLRSWNDSLSPSEIADIIRHELHHYAAGEFHGTWSAGVIAAQASHEQGAMGVAPEAKILPIRVFGLDGAITSASLIEAVGYAAARGADVINLSLGGLLPDQEFINQVFSILDENPELVIVASAGNDNLDGVSFPAGIPGVLSVGATNSLGQRSPYSSYGANLDVVAPGGDISLGASGGIFTTGGTWLPSLWEGHPIPQRAWGPNFDPLGQYVQVQGTSFSAPAASGIVALLKSVDTQRLLNRDQILEVLQSTASYGDLTVGRGDENHYRLQAEVGFGSWGDVSEIRPSGIYPKATAIPMEEYFFGRGLLNAGAAVEALRNSAASSEE